MRPIASERLPAFDYVLVFLLLVGIYLEVAIYLSPTVPIPAALAGAAGMALIWRRRNDFTARQLAALFGVIVVLLASSIAAPDLTYLPKRMTGLVQMVYSLVIAFSLFLTLIRADRRIIARMLFCMCIVILIGAQLEAIPFVRSISDGARQIMYKSGIYESDLRDMLFYGKVRPKFFTSEPSSVTFAFTLFSLAWFLATDHRHRWPILGVLLAASQLIIPGPTTLLGGVAACVSYLMLPTRDGSRPPNRGLMLIIAGIAVVIAGGAGSLIYAERFQTILEGRDPSFFYRIIGPALVGTEVLLKHPVTGIGLTAEQYGADLAMNVFVQSPLYSSNWRFDKFSEVLTNFFWLHWIYLGLVFGTATLVAISLWLRTLGIAQVSYCWFIWALFGQSSGAYVGPKAWVVLMLTAGIVASLHRRAPQPAPVGLVRIEPVMSPSGLVRLPYFRPRRPA